MVGEGGRGGEGGGGGWTEDCEGTSYSCYETSLSLSHTLLSSPPIPQELLQGLVDSNALGHKTINAGGSEFVLYWLKGQRSQKGSSDLHDAIGGTPPQTQKVEAEQTLH